MQRNKIVAYIPIRSNSKGIPGKAFKLIRNKPLFYYAINAALRSKLIDKVYIAYDTERLKEEIKGTFCLSSFADKLSFFERDPEHHTDEAPQEPGLLDFASKMDFDYIALIQITNPFLEAFMLDQAFENLVINNKINSILGVARIKGFCWKDDGVTFKPINYDFMKRPNRQDRTNEEQYFLENGSFYIISKDNLLKSKNRLCEPVGYYEMPFYSIIEIDEPEDWPIVDGILSKQF